MSEKLVRDNIPRIIHEKGEEATTRILTRDEYLIALDTKLQEEVDEYLEANDTDELADVLEVVYAIAKARGVSAEMLDDIRTKKREERGGFDEMIALMNGSRPTHA